MEIHNGVTEIKMRFKQSALKKNWEIKIKEIVDQDVPTENVNPKKIQKSNS